MAFLTAFKYKSVNAALSMYNKFILEQANTHLAFAELDRARLEALRAIELLNDAETIHEMDRLERDVNLLQAQQRMLQTAHEAELAGMEREAELRFAKKTLDEGNETAELSQDEHELVDALIAKMKPDKYRALLEKTIKEQNFTGVRKEKAIELMEELIKKSL